MHSRSEVLICCCHEDDVAVLRAASGKASLRFVVVDNAVQVAHRALSRPPAAVVLGLERSTLPNLDVIPVLRDVRADLPVIVIARDDSLELERLARQRGVFYYLVHPVEASEAAAVLGNIEQLGRS